MELKVNETQLPQPITFNYEELKTAIAEKAEMYANVVYTDETIKEAKADKATLNKLKKTLNDERIRREKEYMKPFNEFKAQVNEIIAIIDKPVQLIDSQIKDYQERKKTEKSNEIENLIESCLIPYTFATQVQTALIWNPKWLNASFPMKQIEAEIRQKIEDIRNDIETIDKLEKYSFEAREKYFETLNLRAALDTANRMVESERRKAEYEAERQRAAEATKLTLNTTKQVEIPIARQEPEKPSETEYKPQWVGFKAYLTIYQAKELKAFCDRMGIELKSIKQGE